MRAETDAAQRGESFDTLIFLHIPKTAGSTFHSVLNARYPRDAIQNVFGSRYTEPAIEAFMARPRETHAHIRLLKGHMPFGLHRNLPGRSAYITFLRDPVDRVMSQYYYVRRNPHNPLHERVVGGNMSIAEFVSSGIAPGMNNGQCRFLHGDIDEYAFDECPPAMLDAVRANIDAHFLCVGVMERFDESLLLMSQRVGWASPPHYIRKNVSKTRTSIRSLDDDDREVIESFNQLDLQLYAAARAELDKTLSGMPEFADELAAFKDRNRRLAARWGWLPDRFHRFVTR